MKRQYRGILITGIVLSALVLVLTILLCLRNNEKAVLWFTDVFARGYAAAFGKFFSLFPFSVFEWLVILFSLASIALLVTLIVLLCRKKGHIALQSFMIYACVCVFVGVWYVSTAGFAYNREEVPVPQYEKEYSNAELIEIARYFYEDFNALADKLERDGDGNVICPYSFKELSDLIAAEFDKWEDEGYFYDYTPTAKKLLNSWLLSDEGITGITFMPTVEANVNVQQPTVYWASTAAHELSHTKGVMVEKDANMASYYVLVNSDNDFLRYCGYFDCLYNLSSGFYNVMNETEYGELTAVMQGRNPLINKEKANVSLFWSEQYSIITKIGEFFNDLYLKLSSQSEGTDSYDNPVVINPEINDHTGEIEYTITYSRVQKMYFYLYENRTAA